MTYVGRYVITQSWESIDGAVARITCPGTMAVEAAGFDLPFKRRFRSPSAIY